MLLAWVELKEVAERRGGKKVLAPAQRHLLRRKPGDPALVACCLDEGEARLERRDLGLGGGVLLLKALH